MSAELPAPVIVYDAARVQAFEALYAQALAAAGGPLAYTLPYPKYEFLGYVAERKPVVLHGSNDPDIAEFVPRREGVDANPQGNVLGIYAAADGIWPLFFAVLNKRTYRGSMRNGVAWNVAGQEVDFSPTAPQPDAYKVYEFSLNAEQLDKPIWGPGTLYLLPRATFEQERYANGLLSPEWTSRVPVRPLARLAVTPEDFPFLRQVSGHDDAYVFRMHDLLTGFWREQRRTEELADGYALEFEWSQDWAGRVVEYVHLSRTHFPVCAVELTAEAQRGPVWLRLRGPETYKRFIVKTRDRVERAAAEAAA